MPEGQRRPTLDFKCGRGRTLIDSMEPALEIDELKKVYPTGVEALKGTSR